MGSHRRRDQVWNPPKKGGDVTTLFAVVVGVPLLLPFVARFSFVLFAVPFVVLTLCVPRCLRAAHAHPRDGLAWRVLGTCAGIAAAASALAVAAAISADLSRPAFYVGAGASAAMLVGIALRSFPAILGASLERLVDALLFDAVVAAVGIYFVVIPGVERGDFALTLVFLTDLCALLVAAAGALAERERERRGVGVALGCLCAGAAVGDGLVARATFVHGGGSPAMTALAWGAAGIALGVATMRWRPEEHGSRTDQGAGASWVAARIVFPFAIVLTFPTICLFMASSNRLSNATIVYFGAFFVVALLLTFWRQAQLLLEHRRAAIRERRLSGEVVRRNEELEALTALATTMTERLEEEPIVERGLGALRIAARATAVAMHVYADGETLELRAIAGDWASDAPWASREARSEWKPGLEVHGRRQLLRLELRAHGCRYGLVTIVRRERDPLDDDEVSLLRLLVEQLAVALQNARDYRDRSEQALRDPLTGIHNRRFFYEMLEQGLARHERSRAPLSLVVVDLDDFKRVNDSFGHQAGDAVLSEFARTAERVIRAGDTFARLGGEEFALIMPETPQLEALACAERLRRAVGAEPLDGQAITISAGVATFPDDADSLEALQTKADMAMYWAKRHGKNLCAVAGEVVVAEGEDRGEPTLPQLHALVSTVDARHLTAADHSRDVAAYAVALGESLGLDRDSVAKLRLAGLFHDIGMVAVRASTFTKPGPLSDQELAEVRLHPTVGATMLAHHGLAQEALWVRHHHERMDGTGYPDRLGGGEIPFESRVLFVADAFEAMTSERAYRGALTPESALDEIRRCSGTQFDPRVVDALTALVRADRLRPAPSPFELPANLAEPARDAQAG